MVWYILLAVLLFGFLILVHELGHFLTARLFKVSVNEFSIGMGPKLLWVTSKKSGTTYALRALPIGGYVSMVGENEESDAEGSFSSKPLWQRMIVTAAGSLTNLLVGFIIMAILVFSLSSIYSPKVAGFADFATSNAVGGLEVGDTVVKVGPRRVHTANDMVYAIGRFGDKPVSVTVKRNGETTVLDSVTFPTYTDSGIVFGNRDFNVTETNRNLFTLLRHTWYQSVMNVRMVLDSLFDLITGRFGISQVSGPVGVTEAITEVAKTKDTFNLLSLFALLAINLGVMNLLPFPALDGGRLFFMFIELILRKPVRKQVEETIHYIGILLLLGFMVVITFKDITYLFRK